VDSHRSDDAGTIFARKGRDADVRSGERCAPSGAAWRLLACGLRRGELCGLLPVDPATVGALRALCDLQQIEGSDASPAYAAAGHVVTLAGVTGL